MKRSKLLNLLIFTSIFITSCAAPSIVYRGDYVPSSVDIFLPDSQKLSGKGLVQMHWSDETQVLNKNASSFTGGAVSMSIPLGSITKAISLEVYKVSQNFPKEERYAITDQIRRSSSSICANIAEGYGRQITSNADFKRFLVMAKGSCHEAGVWIDYCLDLDFIDDKCHYEWQNEYLEISKMLFGLIKTL